MMSYNLIVNNIKSEVTVTDSGLRYETSEKLNEVEILDVIGIEVVAETSVTVHIIQKCKSPKWSKEPIHIEGEPEICATFVSDIKSKIEKIEKRPKRLLVIVNPIGGAHKGRSVYENVVAPLFNLANITHDVIYSERPKHVTEIISNYDIDKIDGIVLCGGDGTYQECISSLLLRTQKEAGIDYNDPKVEQKKIQLPIGLIPTGTGNAVAERSYGCYDHETAVLHVIRGQTRHQTLGAVYSDNKLVSYFALIVVYGMFCDMMVFVDRQRWMGRLRYFTAPFYPLFHEQREFDVELTVQCKSTPKEHSGTDGHKDGKQNEITKTTEGRLTMVLMFIPDVLNDEGLFDSGDRTDERRMENFTLFMFKKCGRFSMTKFLIDVFSKNANSFNKDYIEKVKGVTGWKIKTKGETQETAATGQNLNLKLEVDGEVIDIPKPEFEIRFLFKAVDLYSS